MVTLALDTGTTTGWALARADGTVGSGVWELSPGRGRPYRTKWLNLWEQLELMHAAQGLTEVVYEEVLGHPRPGGGENTYAAHAYGGMVAVIEMWCEWKGVRTAAINVSTVKKHATGKGNAKKALMLERAQAKWPDQHVVDDNQADALWLLDARRAGK